MRYHDLVKIFRILAGRRRLEIIKLLADGRERSVTGIAENIQLSVKSTSKHLLLLAQTDLVEYRRQQNIVWYRKVDSTPKFLEAVLKKVNSAR